MRILFCNYEYPPLGGGGGVVNAQLAQEMAKAHDVTILTSQGMGLPFEQVEEGVRILRVPVFFRRQEATANLISLLMYIPMGIKRGRELLYAESFDVINTHFALPTGPVGDSLSRHSGIPNILSVHGGDLYDPSKSMSPHRHLLLRYWIRKLLNRADRVVGQSRNTLENVSRFYDAKIEGTLIPLGIHRPKIDSIPRSRYGYKEDDILLVTVGRLVARKAIHQMIQLMVSFRKKGIHLLIIGSGPEESALRMSVQEKGLQKKVDFLGFVKESEKLDIIQMSDIFVSTSQHEGFGLVFLEAMACGLPILCYNNGGQTDFLEDGTTGFLSPLNDLGIFETRLRSLIADRECRQKMGIENLQRVEAFFIDRCAEHYENVFLEAVSRYKKPDISPG